MAATAEEYQTVHDTYKNAVVIGEQKTSEAIDKLWPAYIEAQKNFGEIKKDAEAKVTYKNDASKSFKFRYATLPNIMEAIRRPLLDQGLWITQSMSEIKSGSAFITTVLRHVSGQFMASRRPIAIPNANDQKELGIAETYGRRYSLTSFLGIAADEDTDAISSLTQADRVSHRQADNPLNRPHKPAANAQPQVHRSEVKPAVRENVHWQNLMMQLAKAGITLDEKYHIVPDDKPLAREMVFYCTGEKVTLETAFKDPILCEDAVRRVADGNREFPAGTDNSLLSQVKEKLAEKVSV